MTRIRTGSHAYAKNPLNSGRLKGPGQFRFFNCCSYLKDMGNPSIFVIMVLVLSCTIQIYISGEWRSHWFPRTQLLQCMLFDRSLGEEVVEEAQQSDVWLPTIATFTLFSRITAATHLSIMMASSCLFLISRMAQTNSNFRAWKRFRHLLTPQR